MPEPEAPPTPPETPAEPDDELGDAGKKALENERKARRDAEKQVQQFQARLKEFEDQGKSELEKANSKAAELEQKLQQTELRTLRAEVALEKGLPAAMAPRLLGATKEEMEADADRLVELVKPAAPTPPPSRRPTPKPGVKPADEGDEPNANGSMNEWIRSEARR